MRRLFVENLFTCFGRADHVPVVPAQTDLVQLAILASPGGDLLVRLGTELVCISKDGEAGWTRRVVGSWWRPLFDAVVDEE